MTHPALMLLTVAACCRATHAEIGALNATVQGICDSMSSVNCVGEDLKDIGSVRSAAACCSACQNHAGCNAWTWGWHNHCYLKSGCSNQIKHSGSTSGTTSTRAPSPSPSPSLAPAWGTILGRGYDLGGTDMWNLQRTYSSQVFISNVPDSCYYETSCQHTSKTEMTQYTSTQAWSQELQSSMGLTGTGSYEAVSVTVSGSYGSSSDLSYGEDKSSVFVNSYNRQRCYQMKSTCVTNKAYLLPELVKVAHELPTGKTDEGSMKAWIDRFVHRYGSHITVSSEHGAQVRVLTSSSSQTETSKECLKQSACASVGYLETAKVGLCANQTQCATHKNVDNEVHTSCFLVGGDVKAVAGANSLCSASANSTAFTEFLDSGDLTSGSSAIGFNFKPIHELFTYAGYSEQAVALEKATAYETCVQPRYAWKLGSDGQYGCQCLLSCSNGGTLDGDACVCHCRGDQDHGYMGSTCQQEYGMCQPGPGTGGNQAPHCRDDNQCKNWYASKTCRPAQLCCQTSYGVTCCDFGETCDCGAFDCTCKSVSAELITGAPAQEILI